VNLVAIIVNISNLFKVII